jgi:hypothetical protein
MLVPPAIATRFTVPAKMDYVCVKCGRCFQWAGDPPKLMLTVVASSQH